MTLVAEQTKPLWFEDPTKLKAVRRSLGLSQSDLAGKAKVKRGIIANIETGRRSLSGDVGDALWVALATHEAKQGRSLGQLISVPELLDPEHRDAHFEQLEKTSEAIHKNARLHNLQLIEEVAELQARNARFEAQQTALQVEVAALRTVLAEQTARAEERFKEVRRELKVLRRAAAEEGSKIIAESSKDRG